MSDDITAFFWDVAMPFLFQEKVTKGTMMGFPCLRTDGDFFASAEPKTGDLIIKLPKERVSALIESDAAQPFAPNGRRFKEWALINTREAESWEAFIREAQEFVENK